MTTRDALTEARRRRGPNGYARKAVMGFEVGQSGGWFSPNHGGSGNTWEAAFADATSRERRRIEDERE